MKTIRKLATYIHGFWKDTIFTWLFVLLETISEVLVAFFMQDLLDCINPTGGLDPDLKGVYIYSGIIAGLAIVAMVFGILAGHWCSSAASGFGMNLRKDIYEKIQKFSFKSIDKFSTSSIVTRVTTDVENVRFAFQSIIRTVVRAPFMMIFSLVMAFITAPRLAWIFLIIIPILLAALIFIAAIVHPIFVKVFETYDNLNESVEENVAGMRVVKSYNREEYEGQKFSKVSKFIHDMFIKAEKILAFNSPVMNLAIHTSIILISYIGARLIVNHYGEPGALSIGGFSTLITYIIMILGALMMVSMVYVMITISRNSSERIIELVTEENDIVSPENAVTEVKDGSVDFNNVSFAYAADKEVISDVDLHFKSGTTVGIIGLTGSSKTTLVSFLPRLYDVEKGEVLVGGVNVKDYDLTVLRDSVSMVLQKNTLFSGTIRENLKWGNENATDEEIWAALDIAQASKFVKAFPEGLDRNIDQGGANVSGGQKQRLCIARALLKNPKILILDDSTSACDTHTDALIREGLMKIRPDLTKFIISQRILSIRDCDTIVVMGNGRVVAQGSNDELMKDCELYRDIYESQLGGGDFDEAK